MRSQIEKIIIQNEGLKKQNEFIISQNAELEWATIYHDTINDKEWLKSLALSPGRWAANYSLLYLIVRVLSDFRPERILEFGLGESSKLISAFINNELVDSHHFIIEQDENWIQSFNSRFQFSEKSMIVHLPQETKERNGSLVKSYSGIKDKIDCKFDLYIVDGPHGSRSFSRSDICLVTEILKFSDEFIIIIDDYHRKGEKETVDYLTSQLKLNGVTIFTGSYHGGRDQIVIATKKFKLAVSL